MLNIISYNVHELSWSIPLLGANIDDSDGWVIGETLEHKREIQETAFALLPSALAARFILLTAMVDFPILFYRQRPLGDEEFARPCGDSKTCCRQL